MSAVELVFNDACVHLSDLNGKAELRNAMISMVEVMAELVDQGVAVAVLRSTEDLYGFDFVAPDGRAIDYGFDDWLGDAAVGREERAFLRRLMTKSPIRDGLSDADPQVDEFLRSGFHFDEAETMPAEAAGFALVLGKLTISLASHQRWHCDGLRLYRKTLLADGQEVASTAEVPHASRQADIDGLRRRIVAIQREQIHGRTDFWEHRLLAFPRLGFSPDVEHQIGRIHPDFFHLVLNRLAVMDETARRWQESGGAQPVYQFPWSPESESTMKNNGMREARRFNLPSGGSEIFEPHTRFTRRHRIHFLPDHERRIFVIGYIGDHLPTIQYT